MSKREFITLQLDRLSEQDLDRLLALLLAIEEDRADAAVPAMAAQSALAKDWLSPEEDAAWANLRRVTSSSSTSPFRILAN